MISAFGDCQECRKHFIMHEFYFLSNRTCSETCDINEARVQVSNGLWFCCMPDDTHEACLHSVKNSGV